jgi:enamine deaminase RidA (YjgF/YER057c/UK114 family)
MNRMRGYDIAPDLPGLRGGRLGSAAMTEPTFSTPADPAGYSHAVSLPAGRLVWTSGQIAVDANGDVPAGWEAQTRLVFQKLGRALGDAGAGWADVVKLTLFVVDVAELATVRAVRDEFVDTVRPPTSSLVRVAGLVRPDLLIEVEAVAWRP